MFRLHELQLHLSKRRGRASWAGRGEGKVADTAGLEPARMTVPGHYPRRSRSLDDALPYYALFGGFGASATMRFRTLSVIPFDRYTFRFTCALPLELRVQEKGLGDWI